VPTPSPTFDAVGTYLTNVYLIPGLIILAFLTGLAFLYAYYKPLRSRGGMGAL
jgi:hypothetical protein